MEVPHILSNPAEKVITKESAHSIFYIRSSPRATMFKNDDQAKREYVKLIKRVTSKEDKEQSKSWSTMAKTSSNAIGFVFQKPENRLLILTAAHTIQEAYCEKYSLNSSHISALNKAYYFDATCIHKGREFQSGGQSAKQDDDENYLPATVVAISSTLDLMVLQVDLARLGLICKSEHSTIRGIAELPPPRGEPVLLQGWPENRCDTSVWGNISTVRDYRWLTRENPLGYKMRLTELPGLECEARCSGGPIVNGRLQCVGVCNANLNCCGYAVSVPDIRNFLISCGVVSLNSCIKSLSSLRCSLTHFNVYSRFAAPPPAPPPPAAREGHEDSKAKHDGVTKGTGLQQGQEDNKNEHERGRGKGSKDAGGHEDSKAKHDGAAKGKGLQQGQEDNKNEQRGKGNKDERVHEDNKAKHDGVAKGEVAAGSRGQQK